ncbi:MAG: hypothetical protein PHE84_09100 [bacterium]|nr:hypothetical protein [bacterium]
MKPEKIKNMRFAKVWAAAILMLLGFIPGAANAYTIKTLLSAGCHEKIASETLRTVRLELQTAAPLPLTANERALVDDLEFTPDQDMKDLGGVTLLVGVRDNDLKGRASDDLTQLVLVHGNPDNQDEHCLRNKAEDEPGGSEAAVNDCRKFIRGRVVEALAGLDPNGVPDPAKRTSLPLHLSLRGDIDASLPTYYVRIGQAIHAMADSFTHMYRTADGMEITVVLNWIDKADGNLKESRDGPAHANKMDFCDDPDELRTARRKLATEASIALLSTTLDPQKTPDEKMAAVDGILDMYLSYSPGCNFDNNWCDAPEKQYRDQNLTPFGCMSMSGASGGDGFFLVSICVLLILTILFRHRRKIPSLVAAFMIAGAITLTADSAPAAEPDQFPAGTTEESVTPDPHAPPPPVTIPVPQPGPRDPSQGAWGAYLGLSGSVNKPAFAGQLGIRRRISTQWTFGWDAEWNPWVSLKSPTPVRAGAFNTYGTIILRLPLAYEKFNLRTTVNLGLSYLLIDLYGASKGNIGFYGAISPLGVEWKLSRIFLLIINPLSFAMPIPQIHGVPLTYPQYRFSVGLGILSG